MKYFVIDNFAHYLLIFFFRWADLTNRITPVPLILSTVRFAWNTKNLLAEPVIVAQILNTPSVEENRNIIYQSTTTELRIDGTGFIGAKRVSLYFKPPLTNDVSYEDISPYPLQQDQIILRLRH